MATYTVKAGDSPASVAGQLYGDQRQYLALMQANPGMWHPGDVINLPDPSGLPKTPVITQAQFDASSTGYKNGQAQYGNQNAGTPKGPAPASYSQPAVPSFSNQGSAGQYDSRTGSARGTSPWAPPPANPLATPRALTTPSASSLPPDASAGTYDRGRDRSYNPSQGVSKNQAAELGPGNLRVPNSVQYPAQLPAPLGNGPNPALYTTTNPGAGDPGLQALGSLFHPPASPLRVPNSVKYQQNPITPVPAPTPGPSTPWSQQRGGWNAQYGGTNEMTATMEALTAYAGGFDGSAKGDRRILPAQIIPHTANQIPLPPGVTLAQFMAKLGYTPDSDGSWHKQNPAVNQGYGNGGSYFTQTAVAAPYQPYYYGGYGGGYRGGYTPYYPSSGGGGASNPKMGLVGWRIEA